MDDIVQASLSAPLNDSRALHFSTKSPSLSSTEQADADLAPKIPQPSGMTSATPTTALDGIRAGIKQDRRPGKLDMPEYNVQDDGGGGPPRPGSDQISSAIPRNIRPRYRERFDRSMLRPDRNTPFNAQIMEHVTDWAELGSMITNDQRRNEVLDRVFETLKQVWFEALRLGYDSGAGDKELPRTSKRAPADRGKKSITPSRVYTIPPPRQRHKREMSPSSMPVLISKSYKDSQRWAVTAGELQEASVSEKKIQVLNEVGEVLEREISRRDWYRVMDATKLNPRGRNLFLYSLYEVQMSRQSLAHLEFLYRGFNQVTQKLNTQRRIDDEKGRHDLFMALALELDEMDSSSVSTSNDHRAVCVGNIPAADLQNSNQPKNLLGEFIHMVEMLLNETDPGSLVAVFEASGFPSDNLVNNDLLEDPSNNFDRGKHALSELLVKARELRILMQKTDQVLEFDQNCVIRFETLKSTFDKKRKH
ncbi:uncharacterized protein Z518_09146 [Rhinocladiella mackenziei CBS 650.93]|uniref:Uncharacterized protein n=1 Tax=Rhinocladiella mackenziei CBS 650.93 TaxID=1442369 RepID=A0A0D2IXX3_9EURO|nr:uncharacterized protein Z518_09146 [Rhinocladiella mackenziei CBS 650.93]KIX01420.1 hypothetical protein Z518_09146 [Rhinocladiella mackenziei CBS 650.93]